MNYRPIVDRKEFNLEVFGELMLMYFFYGVLVCELCADPKVQF